MGIELLIDMNTGLGGALHRIGRCSYYGSVPIQGNGCAKIGVITGQQFRRKNRIR